MKQILLMMMLLLFAGNSQAQSGATSADAIGKLLYTAIKTNNFSLIQNYCLTEAQLNELRQQEQAATPNGLNIYTADEFNQYLRTNFDTAVKERSTENLTWKGVGLKKVNTSQEVATGGPKQQVSLLLTDAEEQEFQVQFDTISLNNTYYYMGNIRLVNE